jgi:hypothetical protein
VSARAHARHVTAPTATWGPIRTRRAWLAGLAFGLAGALWILASHRFPLRALHYHVPLAVAFGTAAAHLALDAPPRTRRIHGTAMFAGLLLVAARLRFGIPLSGHGVLGALIGVLAPTRALQLLGWAILPQAAITKWIRDEDVHAVPIGTLTGLVLALWARWRSARE